jgi:enoyl-CoA hydratase/carnithine racemase
VACIELKVESWGVGLLTLDRLQGLNVLNTARMQELLSALWQQA